MPEERHASTANENPYEPPKVVDGVASSRLFSRFSRFYGACILGILGSVVGGAIVYWIYVADPRTGTAQGISLSAAVYGAAACCGTLWAVAGAITELNKSRMLIAHGTALVVFLCWIGIGGTYSDVVSAATVAGWPLGGVAGSLLARYAVFFSSKRYWPVNPGEET